LVDYLEADHYFELAHRLTPCMLDGMDIYSTVLYVSELTEIEPGYIITTLFIYLEACMLLLQHLNEEMRLSYLAQELISIDRLSPQAWYIFVSFQKVVTMLDSFVIPVSQFCVFLSILYC
jgi:anaphase-promoting complex subunit 3